MKVEINFNEDKKKLCTDLFLDLGYAFEKGIITEQNYSKALELYTQAAENGSATANNNLGWMYMNGLGVEQDLDKAKKYFKKAIKKLNTTAMVNLGTIYEGQEKYKKAFALYKEAALLGNWKALFNYANMYHWGYGVKRDRKVAYLIFKSLEDIDDAVYFYLGLYYQKGYVVGKNYVKAIKYYKKGVAKNDKYCCCQLAYMYGKGRGVKRNYNKAFKYYQKAAELGDDVANRSLGFYYEHGRGVEKNLDLAFKYYQKAVEMGITEAQEDVERVEKEIAVQQDLNKE